MLAPVPGLDLALAIVAAATSAKFEWLGGPLAIVAVRKTKVGKH